MGYGIYTMRETHIPRGLRPRGIRVSLMVYMPYHNVTFVSSGIRTRDFGIHVRASAKKMAPERDN